MIEVALVAFIEWRRVKSWVLEAIVTVHVTQ